MDAVLRVVDTQGVQVALNHDYGGTLDPFADKFAPVRKGPPSRSGAVAVAEPGDE